MEENDDITRPGPEHARLLALVGTWILSVEGAPGKGTAEIESVLGGRFIVENVHIPFGEFDMDWHGVIGFDRASGQYTGSWFDSMNNVTRSSSGEYDDAGRVLTFRGGQADGSRFVWRITLGDSNKTLSIDMFSLAEDGSEAPLMHVHGARQD